MAIVLKVHWVEPSGEPEMHRRIKHIGGVCGDMQWKHSHSFAIESIERGQFAYYVEKGARLAEVNIAQASDGSKVLAVGSDPSQLLLDLPAFPPPLQARRS